MMPIALFLQLCIWSMTYGLVIDDETKLEAMVQEYMAPTLLAFKSEITQLKDQYAAVVMDLNKLKGNAQYGVNVNVSRRTPGGADGVYAFYAYSSGNQYLTSGHYQALLYDNIVTNFGSTYNERNGQFTCSVPGTYVFSWTSYVRGDVPTNLLLNGKVTCATGTQGQATNLCVMYLHQGDMVYIRAQPRGTRGDDAIWSWSSFSGFLLA